MSIVPALLAIQIATSSSRSRGYAGGGRVIGYWSRLSGWRAFLFGVGLMTTVLLGLALLMVFAFALAVGVAALSPLLPMWATVLAGIAAFALWIGALWGGVSLLYG